MLFTRVWRRVNGTWKLFSVTQFRDPKASRRRRRGAQRYPRNCFALEYELFQNDALLGRPTVHAVSGRPWIDRDSRRGADLRFSDLAVRHRWCEPDSSWVAPLTASLHRHDAGTAECAARRLVWTSGTGTYRLRIRTWPARSRPAPVSGWRRRSAPGARQESRPDLSAGRERRACLGLVIIELVIDEAGNVADAKIVRSVPMLDAAALDAVRQWQYTPTLLERQPRPSRDVGERDVRDAVEEEAG